MLKIIGVKISVTDLILVHKNNTVNEFGDNSKIIEIKIKVQMAKFKSNNTVQPFLAKLKLFGEISKLYILTLKTRLNLAKTKQIFIKIPTFHQLDLECHIHIKPKVSGYDIIGLFS